MERNKNPFKEFIVVNGKCPHCGLTEVYVSDNPFHDTFMVRTEAGSAVFAIQCYLCLNCRAMELHAAERSPSLFGKSKALVDEVPKSANWNKAA
jgi:predicted nucleic-acid-binding Zn-ribbon protein